MYIMKNGFYKMYEDYKINRNFKKSFQFSEGYYLDEAEENGPLYKLCFDSCLTCDIEGNKKEHNCK